MSEFSGERHSEPLYPKEYVEVVWSRKRNQETLGVHEKLVVVPELLMTTVDNITFDPEAVENVMMALTYGQARLRERSGDALTLELQSLSDLPDELVHVMSPEVYEGMKDNPIWGNNNPEASTYLQTKDLSVEATHDDIEGLAMFGCSLDLICYYVDSATLNALRDVYIDPESLFITPREYGASFMVQGGVPTEAVSRIERIRINPKGYVRKSIDTSKWLTDSERASQDDQSDAKFRSFLSKL